MHWPLSGNTGPQVDPPLDTTWAAMEALVDKGLVRAIGVSNFSPAKLEALRARGKARVSVLQAERHPYWRNDELVAYCAQHGIHFSAYSALGSRHSAGTPGVHEGGGPELVDDPRLRDVARQLGKSVQQVCIRWALQARPDCSLIAKSSNPEHIKARPLS